MSCLNLPVTVVIPTKNEEKNLRECLHSLSGFAKVIVVDSQSTDCTAEIAREMGAVVVPFKWNGNFPKKRNWYLRNFEINTPWILFIDADEYVSDELKNNLAAILPVTNHVGFWLNYTNHFLGKPLKYGDSIRKLALFRPNAGEYELINDKVWSDLDMEVHEHPVLSGSIGRINIPIRHEDFKGIKAYIDRHNHYSSWEAQRCLSLKNNKHEKDIKFTWRQRVKYSLLDTWFFGPIYFFFCYVIKLGFMDGAPGFVYAISKMIYFWQIKIKIQEILICQTQSDKSVMVSS